MYQLLLVDDEPVIRMTFRNLLPWDDSPWHIAGMVSNGEEALAFLAQHSVDIIITDMKMPQMNGLELIRHLKEQRFPGAILVLSNYSDFSLVRQAMQLGARDYMLKTDMEAAPMREALERLSENLAPAEKRAAPEPTGITDDYRRTVLRDLMLGYAPTEESDWNDSVLLPHAPYRMLDVVMGNLGERPVTYKSIRNVLLANFNEQTDVIYLGEQEYICLIPAGKENEDALLRRSVQLVRQLKMYLNSRANILVSSPFADTEALRCQLGQCQNAAKLFFYEISENCLAAERIVFSSLAEEALTEEAACQLADAFSHSPDRADSWITALMQRCADRRVDPELLRSYVFQILQALLLNHPQTAESAVFASHLDVLSCKSAERLCNLLHALLPSLLETPAAELQTGNHDVRTLILYLQQHYTEHISLDTLSATVNLNRSYLCRLFKRETGESLFQHLARLRLERATGLLLQEGLSIREVAARVGIDDPFYFTRMFKKQYGVAPSEYAIQKKSQQTGIIKPSKTAVLSDA